MSLSMTVTRRLTRLLPGAFRSPGALRHALAHRGAAAGVTAGVRRVARVRETAVDGWPVARLVPRRGATGAHLVYLHGGGYVQPLSVFHWWLLERLVASGVSVSVPHYGLAPEHHADEAHAFLDELWRRETARHDRVFLAGDSAGGGLALAQAQRHRDAGLPTAGALLLFAPWLDVTLADPESARLGSRDSMLDVEALRDAGRLWAGGADLRDPSVSPLYGDLSGLPPVYTYQGDHDVLMPDAKTLTRRIQDSGGRAELRIARGGFHVHVAATWTPESRRALAHAQRVLRG